MSTERRHMPRHSSAGTLEPEASDRTSLPGFDASAPCSRSTDLNVRFPTDDGVVHAVRGVSYTLRSGEVLGIVGESGSGKSVTSLAVMGLLPTTARDHRLGRATAARSCSALNDRQMSRVRGKRIAMIFQDPMTSLDPVYKVGWQIAETVRDPRQVAVEQGGRGPGRSSCWSWSASRTPASRVELLPARVLRRHAPARRHRDRDGQPARGDHRRRADHRAGRDRAGAGPRGARDRAGGDRRGDGADHPRPRRRRRHGRPGAGHVRRPAGRDRHRRGRLLPRRGCPTRSACSARCRASTRDRRAADPDPGLAAVAGQPAAGLPVRARAARCTSPSATSAEPDLRPGRRRAGHTAACIRIEEVVEGRRDGRGRLRRRLRDARGRRVLGGRRRRAGRAPATEESPRRSSRPSADASDRRPSGAGDARVGDADAATPSIERPTRRQRRDRSRRHDHHRPCRPESARERGIGPASRC